MGAASAAEEHGRDGHGEAWVGRGDRRLRVTQVTRGRGGRGHSVARVESGSFPRLCMRPGDPLDAERESEALGHLW